MIAWLAKSALMQSPVGGLLKAIPRPVWLALAIAAACIALILWHRHEVSKARKEGHDAGVAETTAAYTAKAAEWTKQINALTDRIRSKNRATNAAITERAGALLVRGPGKAACANPAAPSPGRQQPTAGKAGPALDTVPDRERVDLIGLPFAGAIALAESHDLCQSDLSAYRERDKELADWWAKASR